MELRRQLAELQQTRPSYPPAAQVAPRPAGVETRIGESLVTLTVEARTKKVGGIVSLESKVADAKIFANDHYVPEGEGGPLRIIQSGELAPDFSFNYQIKITIVRRANDGGDYTYTSHVKPILGLIAGDPNTGWKEVRFSETDFPGFR